MVNLLYYLSQFRTCNLSKIKEASTIAIEPATFPSFSMIHIRSREEYNNKIEAEMPNIHLEYLPEYSPDYNLIELVWHSLRQGEAPTAKEYIANRLFESIEKLESLLNQLLNEDKLVINWGRKLKNKGNALIQHLIL